MPFCLNRLYRVKNAGSKLSFYNEVTLFETCIRPVLTYAGVVSTYKMQKPLDIQNGFMCIATGVTCYVKNLNLHKDPGQSPKSFCGLSTTLAAKNICGYDMQVFGQIARSEEVF
ncbi:hypothetical protein EVAR_7137_1 [Eumeta japonica]|uniref:Uncharacterized protein n=1 Tax=Eumeta variegata TaxID=151549 RepID=A0A4C1U7N3_EUMVA|nr:hypothetical protein EVAR_7137_1 [Eumeta japonica]